MCYLTVFSLLSELNALSNYSKLTYEMGFHVFSFYPCLLKKLDDFLFIQKRIG